MAFYEVLRLCGGTIMNDALAPGGSANENPSRARGEGRGREVLSFTSTGGVVKTA